MTDKGRKTMILQGKVWKFGDDVDTDAIIPVNRCGTTDVQEMGKYCMEGLDPEFARKVQTGDIMVVGKNFGCGSSREPAPIALKATGISCIIAKSFGRIFYRNAFNVGLPLLECPLTDSISQGDKIEVNLDTGEIRDVTTGRSFRAQPIPPFMQDLLAAGGLLKQVVKKLNLKVTSNA
jgi:3-isopropylmalate/(R)-2-methylmalate dehydratase small subunit